MPNRISSALIKADKVCDYIPGVSTVSNTVNILTKTCLEVLLSEEKINKSEYLSYLCHKSFSKCMTACIPFYEIIANRERISSLQLRPDIIIRRHTEV